MWSFDFYGYQVQLQSENPDFQIVFENLASDFSHFRMENVSDSSEVDFQIQFSINPPTERNSAFFKWPLFQTRMCRAYGWHQRFCDYGQGHGVWHERKDKCHVFGTDSVLIYEMAYTLMLSKTGEELETRRGWLKLHALGFFANEEAVLALLPSGGGKSHLAKRILDETRELLFGDEILFCDGRFVYPFPIRLALRENSAHLLSSDSFRVFKRKRFDTKYLLPIPKDRVAPPARVRRIFLSSLHVQNGIRKPRLQDYFHFLLLSVSGWGLPQMREHLIRKETFFELPFWAFQRFKTSLLLLRQSEFQILQMNHQTGDSLDLLYHRLAPKDKAWSTRKDEVNFST